MPVICWNPKMEIKEMNKKAAIIGIGYVGISLSELFLKGGW